MTEGVTGGLRLLDGRYQLTERIGSGGMGTVYRAHDTRLDRPVAVKVLRTTDDEVHRARLRAEARFAGGLQHPGIVRVYDYGEEEGPAGTTPYIVMQLVEGIPLTAPLPPGRVAHLLVGIGQALAAAHAAGVVHRDLKPSNILLTSDGRPVLVDFGVARSDTAEPLTETGFVVGTAEYLSPEQVEGAPATPASDVYALGVVAHQCLTGSSPFQRETPVATALAHLRDDPPELPSGVPAGLRTLLRAMLSRTPEERPTAAEVAARAAVAPTTRTVVVPPMPATPPAPPVVVGPWARRRIVVVTGGAVVLVAALLLAALQGRDPTAPAAAADTAAARHTTSATPHPVQATAGSTKPAATGAARSAPPPPPKHRPEHHHPKPHGHGPGHHKKPHGPKKHGRHH
ncbi:serine/threonine-protein kinase [Nocardioides sp. HB32]